jgi:membrane-anchored mycosin MYCP
MLIEVGPSLHHSDQLVVDLAHLEFVQHMLGELGIRHAAPGPDDQDELLGLARLRELTDAAGGDVEVSEILTLLRREAAAQRGGLVPVVGKNRLVEAVIGEGHKPMHVTGDILLSGHKPMVTPTDVSISSHKPMSLSDDVGISSHKPMSGADPEPAVPSQLPDVSMTSPDAGRGVRVGLVDTPLAPAEPGTPENPLPYRAGHAEFVTSLIRRQAPAAEIHLAGVLDPETGRADSWDTARAMLRLVTTHQLHILNLSLAGYSLTGPSLVMLRAIERLASRVLVIAAAGNHGGLVHLTAGRTRTSAAWPAAIPPAHAVGSVDADGHTAPFSPRLRWVECMAPGVDVVGSYLKGEVRTSTGVRHFDGLAQWSGTSFSAATVSGAVAACTVPGSVSPRQALADLLAKATLVRPFTDAP